MDHLAANRAAYDKLARDGAVFAKCATDEECQQPLATLDSRGWLPKSVQGMNVLCLAAGGGWQSILYATAGANVTVVDLSPQMLALDHREARRRSLSLRIIEGSMDDLSELVDGQFDIVHQPVSTCYVPEVLPVFKEVARVLKNGGIYISQHKSPVSLQVAERDARDRYVLGVGYYHQGPLPAVPDQSYRENGAVEYLHRFEQIVGGMCLAGLHIEALTEPYRGNPQARPGDFRHRGLFVAPYIRVKARREERESTAESQRVWIPG
ncbi:MAG: class I SAM-dependent methyltransferase [Rubinisphaera brasiliensis]|uniref:class I SAM-dependent methyltransferase n=1 Tax=Rubinisphaera brasiliensis TaxID=119 RepID=UPI003918878A